MSETGYQGAFNEQQPLGDYAAQVFLVKQILSRVNTATLVKVTAVTNSGGVSPVGFVDVQPLVNQLDGSGKQVPHGVVHHLPYFRLQGGTNAVILDPQVNDIGIAVFADKDISVVKSTKAQGNPGSGRQFNMADGLYIGGVLNGTPTQYVQFSGSGMTLVSPTKISMQAPEIDLVGIVNQSGGNLNVADDMVVAGMSTVSHDHTDPQGGTVGPMQN